ncbi:MAG: MFS transporter [Bacillaceae bacterium]|nr:MFS transporter [Bacillaceae bacterium]
MTMFFSGPGQTFSVSVFIDSYIETFGWSRSFISGVYSASTVTAGLLLFIIGRLVDKYGQRHMTAAVSLFSGIACLLSSLAANPIILFLAFMMLRLFGQGSMTLIPQTLVPQWFIHKRGRALSFVTIGITISSALLPPLNTWMIQAWGWENAWRVWSALLILFFAPLAFFLIRNQPEDIGLNPDNAPDDAGMPSNNRTANPNGIVITRSEENWTLKEAMRTRSFWLILLCVAIPAMLNTGIIFHFVSIMGENSVSATTTSLVLSLMAVISFPVTFVAGFLSERVSVNRLLAFSFAGQMFAMLFLLIPGPYSILFGVVRGIVQGFEVVTLSIVWPNYFGRRHLGSIKGIVSTTTVVSSALGPIPFGWAYDFFGGYQEILIMMLVFPLLGAIAAFVSPPPKKTEYQVS